MKLLSSYNPDFNPPLEATVRIMIDTGLLYESGFTGNGIEEFEGFQIANAENPMKKGPLWEFAHAMLGLNGIHNPEKKRRVEFIIGSQQSPDVRLRTDFSTKDRNVGLDISRMTFTGDDPAWQRMPIYGAHIYYTHNQEAVQDAILHGYPAMHVPKDTPVFPAIPAGRPIRLGFDMDRIVLGSSSDDIFDEHGPKAYRDHERDHANVAMEKGLFFPYAAALTRLKRELIKDLAASPDFKGWSTLAVRKYVRDHILWLMQNTIRGGGINGTRATLALRDPDDPTRMLVSFDVSHNLGQGLDYPVRQMMNKGVVSDLEEVDMHHDDGEKHSNNVRAVGRVAAHADYTKQKAARRVK